MNLNEILYPQAAYSSRQPSANAAFNTVLQEFSHRIDYISGLHTGGKLSSQEAFDAINSLWQQLETQRRTLRIISTHQE